MSCPVASFCWEIWVAEVQLWRLLGNVVCLKRSPFFSMRSPLTSGSSSNSWNIETVGHCQSQCDAGVLKFQSAGICSAFAPALWWLRRSWSWQLLRHLQGHVETWSWLICFNPFYLSACNRQEAKKGSGKMCRRCLDMCFWYVARQSATATAAATCCYYDYHYYYCFYLLLLLLLLLLLPLLPPPHVPQSCHLHISSWYLPQSFS